MSDFIVSACTGLKTNLSPSDKIYKDDCMFSFDTPENNANGLDICMSCYQAFARAPHKNYTAEHYQDKRHSLYVNITKRLKSEEERKRILDNEDSTRQTKIPRLEVTDHEQDEFYNVFNSIYVAPLDTLVPLDECPEPASLLAQQILTSNSASTNDEIKTWEQQVFPCAHSSTIEQTSATADLSHCASCDLGENLWVCLTCAAVGCGREQFGSSLKGNSHALVHFEQTGHAVAVKLGSLAADEDSCDCYCYSCNDEVKVPQLGAKLLQIGIDLNSAVKTEKSLIELNLETNKNWQFNLDGTNGDKLEPVFGPGLTGLANLGNSCYLSSVVQALFSYESYDNFFRNLLFDKHVADPAMDLRSQMLKLYDGLLSGRYSKPNPLDSQGYQAGIKPSSFKTLIGAEHAEFKTNKQQDAYEFLLYLLDKLDREYGLSLNEEFKFLLTSKVLCTNCKSGTLSTELVDNVSVPLEEIEEGKTDEGKPVYKEMSLPECFKRFAATEEIENYKCDTCGETSTALKTTGFRSHPKNLIVGVNRIKLENWIPMKKDVAVDIPDSLQLSSLGAPSFELGETEVLETQNSAFVPNEEAMSMLSSMGFGEARSARALFHTGNKNAEEAMNWLFEHMDDPGIDDPFDASKEQDGNSAPENLEAIDNLVAMGFSALLAKKALHLNGNDVNASVEWLFSNPDDDGVIHDNQPVFNIKEESEKLKKKLLEEPMGSGNYRLKAVVCHKGSSPHTGHYVVFVRIKEEWVLFNDEKVVRCDNNLEDMRKNGYIYFFSQD